MSDHATYRGPVPQGTPFTSHELLYLLSLNATAESDTTREHLRLGDPVEEGTQLYAAGAATLAVRGLLEQHGEDLVPKEEIQALTAVLTRGDRWVELGLLGREAAEGALFVAFRQFAAMLSANNLGIFTAVALESSDALAPSVVDVLRTFLTANQPGAVSVNVTDVQGKRRAVVHYGEDGRWQYGTDPENDDGTLTPHDIEGSDVDDYLTSLILGTPDVDGSTEGNGDAPH